MIRFMRHCIVGPFIYGRSMRKAYRIGILYSTSGPYAAMGRDCRDAVDFAIEQSARLMPGLVEPVHINPGANLNDYIEGARTLLRDAGCRHIVGTVTSAARKEIIPVVEKHDGLLWYTCPYEGFEANANVIYTGACPNQHLLPMFDYLLPRYGKRPYLVGANYVWGWEMNRLARELVGAVGGVLAGERYLPVEETSVERLIADIEQERPSFILNNLIGTSSYAFLTAIKSLAERKPEFAPDKCPVVSCDFTECELGELPPNTATGQLSAACYFDSADTPENEAFHKVFVERFGAARQISSIFASTYVAAKMCIEAIRAAGSDEPLAVRQQLYSTSVQSLLGPLRINPQTHHAALPFMLGRVNATNGFDIISALPAIEADPYLSRRHVMQRPRLRVVS
jgi:urea transport system substrate-binding protein